MGLWGSFTGDDQADAARASAGWGIKHLNRMGNYALDEYDQGYGNAQEYLDPYVQSGGAGQEMYANLLGLNGADQRGQAQNLLMSDPAFQGQLGQDQNAMLRAMNAQGRSNSGAGALAAERVFQQNYGTTLNRYAGLGQQGMQAAGQSGALAATLGQQRGDLKWGKGQLQANLKMGGTNASNAAKTGGLNNMLSLAGTATKAFGLF